MTINCLYAPSFISAFPCASSILLLSRYLVLSVELKGKKGVEMERDDGCLVR